MFRFISATSLFLCLLCYLACNQQSGTKCLDFDDALANASMQDYPAEIDFENKELTERAHKTIRDGYDRFGQNFGAFYTLISWECGPTCQQIVLVDQRDGKIYNGPRTALGYNIQKNSRVLFIYPSYDEWKAYVAGGSVEYEVWLWDESAKKFVFQCRGRD
ncbi:MAG: hypothetical protein AB8G77_23750 [Rhodothermales bacterium]